MTKRNAVSIALAAGVLLSLNTGACAQAPSPHAKAPSDATGSGKDTGMNVQSGMSGNGSGGVGSAASPAATGANRGSSRMKKKSSKRSSKHSKSGASRMR